MADITYGVNVEYLSTGNLSLPGGSNGIDKAVSSFDALKGAAHSFNGVLDSIIGGMLHLGVAAAEGFGAIAAAGFGLAVKESIKFNSEMESAQTSIATMANAAEGLNGFIDPKEAFGNQYRLAGDVIKQMRKDAQELPGSFSELQRIMTDLSGPAENAGLGQAATEKMAADAMLAGSAAGVPLKAVGRELGEILSGSARISNPLFRALHMGNAKDVNKMSQKDRLHATQDALAKLGGGGDSVKQNWSTISSNFLDNLKIGVGIVGGPLFDRVKQTMKAFNDSDKGGLAGIGQKIGDGLLKAFDLGEAAIRKWFPIIHTFMETMYNGFHRIFTSIAPMLHAILDKVAAFMQDPAAFSKIEHLVGTLLALRVGGGVLEAGAGLAGGGMKMGAQLAQMGVPALEALGPVALGVAAALAVAAVGAYGFTSALTDSSSAFHGAAVAEAGVFTSTIAKLGKEMDNWVKNITPIAELLGVVLAFSINTTIEMFTGLVTICNIFGNAIMGIVSWIGNKITGPKLGADDVPDLSIERDRNMSMNLNPIKRMDAFAIPEKEAPKPPQHTTHIHKVEIKVNSNQDPSRIAREVKGVLNEEARNPRSAAINPAGRFSTRSF